VTFHINQDLTINEIAEIASFAKNTQLADRVGRLHVSAFRVAEDRQRNAFMFETAAVARDTCVQNHYLLYFMGHWFDVRSKNVLSNEVSFYNYPPGREAHRKLVEQCFGQAARIYGNGEYVDAPIFDPIFCSDDWYPAYI
jgi:hypothetical protein